MIAGKTPANVSRPQPSEIDDQHTTVDMRGRRRQRPGGRPLEQLPVSAEPRAMAGTLPLAGAGVPAHDAAFVRAMRRDGAPRTSRSRREQQEVGIATPRLDLADLTGAEAGQLRHRDAQVFPLELLVCRREHGMMGAAPKDGAASEGGAGHAPLRQHQELATRNLGVHGPARWARSASLNSRPRTLTPRP